MTPLRSLTTTHAPLSPFIRKGALLKASRSSEAFKEPVLSCRAPSMKLLSAPNANVLVSFGLIACRAHGLRFATALGEIMVGSRYQLGRADILIAGHLRALFSA